MSLYTKPILRYGVATPLIINTVLFSIALLLNSELKKIRKIKEELYSEQKIRIGAIKSIENDISSKKLIFEDKKRILQSNPNLIFTRTMETLLPKYREIELQQTSMVFPLEYARANSQIQTETSLIKSEFAGGFGPMQETLLQIESVMPQSNLQEIKITRKSGTVAAKPESHLFEITHFFWKTESGQ